MYAEIERLIKETLEWNDSDIYQVDYSDEDGEILLGIALPLDPIRDMLLEYYYRGTDPAFVTKALTFNFQIDPLIAIELVGAVDELKQKNRTNLP